MAGGAHMVFWWTGRGFLALLSLIGVIGLFGAVLTFAFGDSIFIRLPWLWGVGLLLAAVINWVVGCRINRRPYLPKRSWRVKFWLSRPARHRFMSLAMELWSIPAAALGLVLVVRGLLPH
jgi:hypothetical protein